MRFLTRPLVQQPLTTAVPSMTVCGPTSFGQSPLKANLQFQSLIVCYWPVAAGQKLNFINVRLAALGR
jgi:hypothetical protein